MKKIPSLFKRHYGDGPHLVYDEVVEGCEWVTHGQGVATEKYDGTACAVIHTMLHKRYDRKLTKAAARRKKRDPNFVPVIGDFKALPIGWIACEEAPNVHTGHWPGWIAIMAPMDKWHVEAYSRHPKGLPPGTYELVGPKIGGNPYRLTRHELWRHGKPTLKVQPPTDFDGLKAYLWDRPTIEGIVWHHPDGRMCKIKRRDFGFTWNQRYPTHASVQPAHEQKKVQYFANDGGSCFYGYF